MPFYAVEPVLVLPPQAYADPQAAEWQEVHRVADAHYSSVRDTFLNAVQHVKSGQLTSDAVLLSALDQILSQTLGPQLLQTALQASQVTSQLLPRRIGASLRFDLVNALAIEWINQYAASLVSDITTQSRLGIRELVRRSFQLGITPQQTARLIQSWIGLTPKGTNAVLNYQQRLVKEGKDADTVEKQTQAYASKLLQDRAKTIARTETIRASNMGQHLLWVSAVRQGLIPEDVERKWIVTPDDRLCPICKQLRGAKAGMDEEFSVGAFSSLTPPLHVRCRCAIGLVL